MSRTNTPDKVVSLTLSERLAAERTRLANERTFMASVRTALGLVAAGTGFGKYLDVPLLRVIFILFIPAGIIVLILGIISFRKRKKELDRYVEEPPQSD